MSASLTSRPRPTPGALACLWRRNRARWPSDSGGRYLVRAIDVQVLKGTAHGRRLVIFEFSSMASLVCFRHSPEYANLKALRESLAELDVWAVSGAAGGLWG